MKLRNFLLTIIRASQFSKNKRSQIIRDEYSRIIWGFNQVQSNQELAKIRVLGEHVLLLLKIFKILYLTYRNRRKRFGLRFNLIAALSNYELHLPQSEFA